MLPRRIPHASAALLVASLALTLPAAAQPTPGFVENFASGVSGWTGGSALSNPGTGGVGGAGDGFLRVSNASATNLGAYSPAPVYAGDWSAAGISEIRLWLNDVGTDQNLELHVSIGNQSNFWTYSTGFQPPSNAWAQYTVPLSGPAGWTQIIGSGTFADALANADRLHLRHDLAPYVSVPNTLAGDFGLDRIELVGGVTSATSSTWGRIKSLYR